MNEFKEPWTVYRERLRDANGNVVEDDDNALARAAVCVNAMAGVVDPLAFKGQVEFYKQREKDICEAAGGVSDGGQYRNDIIEHLQMQTRQLAEAKGKESELIRKLGVTLGALDVLPMPFRVMVLAAIETRLKESK